MILGPLHISKFLLHSPEGEESPNLLIFFPPNFSKEWPINAPFILSFSTQIPNSHSIACYFSTRLKLFYQSHQYLIIQHKIISILYLRFSILLLEMLILCTLRVPASLVYMIRLLSGFSQVLHSFFLFPSPNWFLLPDSYSYCSPRWHCHSTAPFSNSYAFDSMHWLFNLIAPS